MKRIAYGLFLITGIFFLLTSCKVEKSGKPHSVGKSSEIVVVTDNKQQWNSSIGDTIMDFFYQEVEILPQAEPMFTLVNIPMEAFNTVYEKNRNILIIDIDKEAKKATIETRTDIWANTQRVVKIIAPDRQSFFKIFNDNKEKIMDLFLQMEYKRIQNAFASTENRKITNALKKNFGIYMTFPSDFRIAKESKNFMWLRKETLAFGMGLLIYTYNYTDTLAFDPDYILSKRDYYTKAYIPGPSDSSYMIVSRDVILPISAELNFKDNYAVEVRGLWKVENDFMGGPFISYTLIDQRHDKVLTIDAYVYAPSEEKRDLMRQLEAIIDSFKFVEKDSGK